MCGRGCFKINNQRVSITSFTESRAVPVAAVIVTRDPQAWSRAVGTGWGGRSRGCSCSFGWRRWHPRVSAILDGQCGDLRTLRNHAFTGNCSLSSGQDLVSPQC